MGERFDGMAGGWTGPAQNVAQRKGGSAGAAITPSDTTIYSPPLRLVRIGGAGNICIVLQGDDENTAAHRTIVAVAAGEYLSTFAIKQIRATDTNATGIQGWS